MTDQKTAQDPCGEHGAAARKRRLIQRTFPPEVRGGYLCAGDKRLAAVQRSDAGDPVLHFPDRCAPRQRYRGTEDIPVKLDELVHAVYAAMRKRPPEGPLADSLASSFEPDAEP